MSSDFIYTNILKSALKQGAKQCSARNAAQLGSERYRKGIYKKPSMLIEEMIKKAVKGDL